jgi:PPE-repeat protein
MGGVSYLVGGLSVDSRKAASGSVAAKKSPEPDAAEAPAAAAATEVTAPVRRRRVKAKQLGRGYEYMDLEPEPVASSERGAGPLGFAGTTRAGDARQPSGLTTLADDSFGSGATTPMMPSSWDHERD